MVSKLLHIVLVAILVGNVMLFSGCESDAGTGAVIGGAAGAGIGAIIGNQSGSTGEGALIGGAVGAGAGYLIGNESDKKKAKQEQAAQTTTTTTTAAPQEVIVNITNSNGSVTPVKLVKQGNVYVGPKGETYTALPTEEQLKPVYGF